MRKRTIAAAVGLVLGGAAAAQSPLDAPAVPKQPTVRTELHRAWIASSSCDIAYNEAMGRHHPWSDQGHNDLLKYHSCMNKIVEQSAQTSNYSEAFRIGMIFMSAEWGAEMLRSLDEFPEFPRSQTAKSMRRLAQSDFARASRLANDAHLTLEEVCEGIGHITDCRTGLLPMLDRVLGQTH